MFVVWIDVVTYLHHTDPAVPWLRGGGWSSLRGALSTVDRRYGWLERLHHHAGHHVVHHLFPSIPHYRLREATRAVRPLLGEYYREDRGGVLAALMRGMRRCRAVPDRGEVVYWEPDSVAPGAAALDRVPSRRAATPAAHASPNASPTTP